jgi:magnesium-transporting ATPase (P-type)
MRCTEFKRLHKKAATYQCTNADTATLKTFYPESQKKFTETQKLIHFTNVFNIFVFLQVFNIINSRKIEGELNIFAEFFNNWLFLFVIILTIAVQIFIVEYGSMATKCYALSMIENLICVGIGMTSLVWGFILKFIPVKLFQWVSIDDKPIEEEEQERSVISKMKKSRVKGTKQPESVQKVGDALLNRFAAL